MTQIKTHISLKAKALCLFFLLISSTIAYSQPPCTLANYGSVPVINASQYPYTSPGTGITVNATLGGGITTLSNFSYNCNGVAYNCTNPAWWMNSAAQSITLTFSVPVATFSVIVNGTNQNEEFYFGVGPGQPTPFIQIVDFCSQQWAVTNCGPTASIIYNGTAAASNMITVSNPPGATVYVLTHNGVGAGSRYALVDCFLAASGGGAPGALTGTTAFTDATCGNCNGTATVNPSGGTGTYTYSWNTVPVQTTQTATGLCAGTYTVTFTSGCQSGTANVTVGSTGTGTPPTLTPAGPFCTGSAPVTFSANPTGGTWSGPGITNPATGAFNPATAGVGTHVITYSVTTPCAASNTMNVVVNPNSSAAITPVAPMCANAAPFNMTGASPGGTWSGTGITNATAGTFDPMVAGAGTHTITYTIAGACGDVQNTNVTVNPVANATITPVAPVCTSSPAFNMAAVDPGGTWSGNGITNAAAGTFDPLVAGAGTHTITYSIAGACGDVQTTNVTVDQQMDATITPAGPFCESNTSATLAAVDPGGTWSGNGITNAATGTFDPLIAGAGTHTITYTIAGACGDSQTTNIQVIADADATINPVGGPFCETDLPMNFTSVQTGGTWTGQGITSAANGTFDPQIAGPGNHVITYTIAGACGDQQSVNVVVNPVAVTTITPAGPFCTNASSVNLTAANPGGTWSGAGITNAATGTFNPATAGAGTHTITYTIGGSCGSSSTTSIVVNAVAAVAFTADTTAGCVPLAVNFTNSNAGSTTCQWSVNGSPVGTNCGGLAYTFGVAGCYGITLQTTDANGCTNSLTVPSMVCAMALPSAEFTASDNSVSVFTPTITFNNLSLGATSYVWNFGTLATSTQISPTFTFPNTVGGQYDICLLAVSPNGCQDSICHMVEVKDEFLLYSPNAFTPDGDGKNDIFLPVVTGHDPESFELFVFTRWGELVFKSTDHTKGWDGLHKSLKSKTDTYVWKVVVKSAESGDKREFIGHITLLR